MDGTSATSAKQPSREKVPRRKHNGNEEKGSKEGSQEEKALTNHGGAQASLNVCNKRPGLRETLLGGLLTARNFRPHNSCLQSWFVLEESVTLSLVSAVCAEARARGCARAVEISHEC